MERARRAILGTGVGGLIERSFGGGVRLHTVHNSLSDNIGG
jgi:hypothetical protein